jgi:GNAT superfamily N-acetyltransferase
MDKSIEIEYRTYRPGDETDLADVFNRAFQHNGGGFFRTPRAVKWRYITRPTGNPAEIQIAVDKATQRIVGSIYSTIEHYRFHGQIYRVGSINDVSTLPAYGGRGIAKKLIQQAIHFMDQQNCIYSILCADPHGHPRSKVYQPNGWEDYCQSSFLFGITNPFKIAKRVLMFPLFPALEVSHIFHAIQSRRIFNELQKRGISIQIHHPFRSGYSKGLLQRIRTFINKAGMRKLDGFAPISEEEWHYFREKPLLRGLLLSYITIEMNGQLIGVGSISRKWIHMVKFGLKLPLGQLIDCFFHLPPSMDPETYSLLYEGFAYASWKATEERDCDALVISLTPKYVAVKNAFRKHGFLCLNNVGVVMLRQMKKEIPLPPQSKKPLFLSPGEIFMYP